jgi:hypothetical protein
MDANKTDRAKMQKYAVIPEGMDMTKLVDLTIGKQYQIDNKSWTQDQWTGHDGFSIKDDVGDVIYCINKQCPHLKGQNWEIQECHE